MRKLTKKKKKEHKHKITYNNHTLENTVEKTRNKIREIKKQIR